MVSAAHWFLARWLVVVVAAAGVGAAALAVVVVAVAIVAGLGLEFNLGFTLLPLKPSGECCPLDSREVASSTSNSSSSRSRVNP